MKKNCPLDTIVKRLKNARTCTLGARAKLQGNEHEGWIVLPELMDKGTRKKRQEIIK